MYIKNRNKLTNTENKLMVTKMERERRGDKPEAGFNRYKLHKIDEQPIGFTT